MLVGWCVGAAGAGFAFGVIPKVATRNVPSSISDTLDNFGVRGSFLEQYLGVGFLLIATVIAHLPASQIGAAADEETSGRLVHLLVGPVRRGPVLAHRLALAAVAVVVAALAAGSGVWAGADTQGVRIGLDTMIGAALMLSRPCLLLVVGIGAVVLALAPRLASPAVYAVAIWSVLVDLLGSMISRLGRAGHLSLFESMALAPAEKASRTRPRSSSRCSPPSPCASWRRSSSTGETSRPAERRCPADLAPARLPGGRHRVRHRGGRGSPAVRQTSTEPPATSRTIPVIHAASSDARKSAASATSSGVPRRRIGWASRASPGFRRDLLPVALGQDRLRRDAVRPHAERPGLRRHVLGQQSMPAFAAA